MERGPLPEEPHMRDPSMTFVCCNKHITLRRTSGGRIKFQLIGFTEGIMTYIQDAYIHTPEQFEKLWEFLGGDKELPKKGERKFPNIKRPTDISGLPI